MKFEFIQGKLKKAEFITDRSFKFGDGVFETIRIEAGKPFNLPFHQKRLTAALKKTGIKVKVALKDITQAARVQNGYVRVHVSRGAGSAGYLPLKAKPGVFVEVSKGLKEPAQASLIVSIHTASNYLQVKSASSLTYVLAAIEAYGQNHTSAILLDKDGNVCECASHNIFWEKGGVLYTPALTLPLVAGSVQSVIMKTRKVKTGKFKLATLLGAEHVYITNVGTLVTKVVKITYKGKVYKFKPGTLEI